MQLFGVPLLTLALFLQQYQEATAEDEGEFEEEEEPPQEA